MSRLSPNQGRRATWTIQLLACGLLLVATGVSRIGAQAPVTPAAPAAVATASSAQATGAVINRYCISCHSDRLKTGGLSLEGRDLAAAATDAELWEKVLRKLHAGMMPPPGMPRPDAAAVRGVIGYLEGELDRAAAARPNPGYLPLHRLNRAEYANAVRDLLGLDIDVSALLPPDDSVAGFDNIAAALTITPVLLERYLSAAMKIAPLATGTYDDGPVESTYKAPADLSQTRHVDGLPYGTRGGLHIRHLFPADGEFVIKATLWRNNAGRVRGLEAPHEFQVLVDNVPVHSVIVGTREEYEASFNDRINSALQPAFDAKLVVRVPIKAGQRSIGVTFVQKTDAQDPQKLRPHHSPFDAVDTHGVPRVDVVTITGPFAQSGTTETDAMRRVLLCRPRAASEELACARRIATRLARLAYRRAVTDRDVDGLIGFYQTGRQSGSFELGVQRMLLRVLTSAEFLFRAERVPATVRAGASYPVSDTELASRLSFFLWSSIPDEPLLEKAARGELRRPAVLEAEVKRMLLDPRAEALTTNFAGQWLYLRNLRNTLPIADEFPDFDDDLRQAFKRETELFFASIVREDRNVMDLLTADYTFVNERLADHYGIPRIVGSHFRRVPVRDEARRGLLGHGSILTVTSNANRTSPVKRGKWVLENIVGTPPPPPPPNVPAFTENKDRAKPLSVREAMEQHRANAACASCHRLMDPIGLALENFDGVGAWRIKDADSLIDASTQMADGTAVDGPVGLRAALVRQPQLFATTLTEKLMTYALGRGLEAHDMPLVRGIVRDAVSKDYRFSSLVLGIVRSTAFQNRVKTAE